jgi:hypothetical protein
MVETPLDIVEQPFVPEHRSDFLRRALAMTLASGLGLVAAVVLSPEVGLVVAGLGGMSSPMFLHLADDLMTASPEERRARVQVLVMTISSVLVGYLTAADGWPFAATWLASIVVSLILLVVWTGCWELIAWVRHIISV